MAAKQAAMEKIAVVGAGMIGRAWAISFARGGCAVALWDGSATVVTQALATIQVRLGELHDAGLIADPNVALARIAPAATLPEAVDGAAYVQENLPEEVDVKRAVFAELDALAPEGTILGSSTSAILPSAFTEALAGRRRCLVAHPANPPYLLPIVELCGAPWTAPEVVERAAELLRRVGQEPIVVRREVPGFILNRLQGALLNEAFRLVEDGYVSPEDLDKTVSHGLGRRWSFMGPLETIALNAPGGVPDYCERYGPFYRTLRETPPDPRPWSNTLIEALTRTREEGDHAERQARRDRRLMRLAAALRQTEEPECRE